MRLRMSRPTWSVPSGYAAVPCADHAGGVKRRSRVCLAGSWGAIQGAASAAAVTTSRMSAPASTAGFRASFRQARGRSRRCTWAGPSMNPGGASVPIAMGSADPDRRIEIEVEHVHEEVHGHDDHGQQEDARLHDGEVEEHT